MLRISKLADYATVVMVYLARHTDRLLNTKDIAVGIGLQQPTVSKLLKLLTNAGLLGSTQGSQGGYRLQHAASAISLAQIIEAIDGSQGLTECSDTEGDCVLQSVCTVSGNWQLISRAIFGALENVSLAQLAEPSLTTVAVDTISKKMGERINSNE